MTSEARLSHIELVSRGGIFLFPSCDLVKSYRHFKLVEPECIKYSSQTSSFFFACIEVVVQLLNLYTPVVYPLFVYARHVSTLRNAWNVAQRAAPHDNNTENTQSF